MTDSELKRQFLLIKKGVVGIGGSNHSLSTSLCSYPFLCTCHIDFCQLPLPRRCKGGGGGGATTPIYMCILSIQKGMDLLVLIAGEVITLARLTAGSPIEN